MSKISQTLVQQQKQSLTAAQIQGLQMLALQVLQLEQRIEHEVEENPALEIEGKIDEENENTTTIDDYIKEEENVGPSSYRPKYSDESNKLPLINRISEDNDTLNQSLKDQLMYLNLNEKESQIADFLIGTLDEDGYLRRDTQTLSDDLIFTQGIDASEDEIQMVIFKIQTLEPAGVAARSLQECLLLQLVRKSDTENGNYFSNAIKIIKDHYDDFVKKHYSSIISKLGLTEDDLRDSIEIIQSLNPKPSNGFGDGLSHSNQVVTPDFIISYQDDDDSFKINVSGEKLPKLKVSKSYMQLAADLKKDNTRADSKEAISFIENKIHSAQWFISALKQRKETLTKTITAIVNRQKEYFKSGEKSKLRPMILKDIANETGYDVSTIWRVVDQKYVQTSFGNILLKDLFSGGYITDEGEEISAKSIKDLIKTLIENEDSTHPYTDQELMVLLNQKGYNIARRTVAKYREQLGFLVGRLRKSF